MPAPRPASAGRPAAARPASPGRRRLGEPKSGNEPEFVPPSPSTLPIFHFKAELTRHQERIETIISEMLVRIPEVTSQAVRDELGNLKLPMNRQRSSLRMSQRSSLQLTGSVADLPGVPQVSLHQPLGEDESLNNQLAFSRSTSSNGKTPSRRPSQQDKLEAWGGIEEEAKFKLDRDKVKGVKDLLEMKKRQLDAATGQRCQRFARMVVAHPKFELGCAMLILVCAVMIGVEAHWTVEHIGSPEPLTFRILNSIFNLLFTVELILRATVDGLYFWSWSNPSIHWNLMDSVLVASGLLEELLLVLLYAASVNLSGLKILRMVRLARILRIVKVVRFFSELRVMVNGVIGSAKSLIWALLLLILVNFLFGVLVMQLSVEYLENVDSHAELLDYFGSLDRTMLTLYESVSGGIDWKNAVVTLRPVGAWMEYIFAAYVFFTVFCCMNIVTGIFVDNAKALKVADEEAMHHEAMKERQKWIVEVADLFSRISEAHEGRLTKQQFVYHVTNSDRIATCFSHLGINTETTNTDELWDLFDMDENGCIDQEEFAMGIKQFHGAARSIDLVKMRREVKELVRLVKEVSFQIS